jgi:transcriptional regulator with XRE-family HTH domain
MRITTQLTDASILEELGARLARVRLARNLTQAALAEQAGVSKRTLERLESGAVATQLSGLLRVCRVLGLMEHFDRLVPDEQSSPMQQLKQKGRKRQRASGQKAVPAEGKKWIWGDAS